MAVEKLSSDRLGEEVRAVEAGGDLDDTNLVMLDGLTDIVVPDVDVLGAVVMDRVVDEVDGALVVLVHDSRRRGWIIQESRDGTQVGNLTNKLAKSNVLSLARRGSNDGLAAAAPRDRSVVVERDEPRRRVAVERILRPVGVSVR